MDDLVRRSDILTALHSGNIEIYVDSYQGLHYLRLLSREIDKVIKATPPVDAVPVVRCRDCKFNKREVIDLLGNHGIQCITGATHDKDWFCADGLKRGG